ncbi:MAG TPA: type IV pilus secretin PilQ [Candidatus Acidoferrales bacterium]|nr:type IV pilus secretin PilQ [Candidatus Acidoferrales bacterium]
MKKNWPAYRLTCLLLMSAALLARPMGARAGSAAPPEARVDAQVTAQAVRLETTASAPFEYTSFEPSKNLLIVDLAGVRSTAPTIAQVLDSDVVSSYRVLPLGTGPKQGARLEVMLRSPIDPRFERHSAQKLTIILEAQPAAEKSARNAPGATSAAPPPPATTIERVAVGRSGSLTSVRIDANGRLTYQAMWLNNPERLALDFSGVRLTGTPPVIASQTKPVRNVRLSQFKPDVARLVIGLDRGASYSFLEEGKRLLVQFTEVPAETEAKPAALAIAGLPLSQTLTERSAGLASPKVQESPPLPPAPAQPATGAQNPAAQNPAPQNPAPQNPPAAAPPQAGKFTGEPISVNLKDVDLKDFFRLIHEISGLNVVLDPNVKGTLTIVLDEVPWDQALDIVLRNNNLDKQLEGNVLRIATRETLKKEAEMKRDLAKAEAEAVDQVTTTRVLSYAKAAAVRDTLKRFLSSRGEILSDDRSNTLIIRDIPSVMPVMDNLIRQLDRKGQQVEIEARVVSASRSFARDIGSQFAFAGTATGGRNLFGGVPNVGINQILSGPNVPTPPLVQSVNPTPAGTFGGGALGNGLPLNTNLAPPLSTSGLTFSHRSPNFALDYILSAAESKGVGKLLSRPKVITQNNEKATVKQGTKIPVQTNINNTISVQFIDAVLRLEVIPQITSEGTVFMEVLVENTQIDQGIPRVQGIPALDTQAVDAHVLINDGGTVVIGGIIISSQNTTINQVPLVGSIPMIGHLFKRTTIKVDSQELLFFLTPRIVPS